MQLIDALKKIKSLDAGYDDLVAEFGAEKIRERYVSLLEMLRKFQELQKWQAKTRINELLLGQALLDYYEDVKRIKDFHENTDYINIIKIVSYQAYWLLRRKPIQILTEDEKELVFANEMFVWFWLYQVMCENAPNALRFAEDDRIAPFKATVVYYLKYRMINPQTLELMLTAYAAGQYMGLNSVEDETAAGQCAS